MYPFSRPNNSHSWTSLPSPANIKVTPMLSKIASHSASSLCPDNFQ